MESLTVRSKRDIINYVNTRHNPNRGTAMPRETAKTLAPPLSVRRTPKRSNHPENRYEGLRLKR